MNELELIVRDDQILADSRNVAEMIEKRHDHLLRDIDNYISILELNPNLGSINYFIPSTYVASNGKENRMFYLTKKGCDMVANKMTGEKGILFTAAYIDKFYQMEEKQKKPLSQLEILQQSINHLVEIENKQKELESTQTKQNEKLSELENNVNLLMHDKKGSGTYEYMKWKDLADELEEPYSATEVAEIVGFRSSIALNKFLAEEGIQKKVVNKWRLTDLYENTGYARIDPVKRHSNSKGIKTEYVMVWTPKGVEFIKSLINRTTRDLSKYKADYKKQNKNVKQ